MNVARAALIVLAAVVQSASVIVTVGGTVSTVKDRDMTSLWFPAASTDLTKKLWGPSESRDAGVSEPAPEQAEKPSPS